MNQNVLQVKNVTKKIKRREIIKEMSFEVKKGDVCGFIGPNGAGKTMMIRLLTALIKPTSGLIFIDNINIIENRKGALKSLGAIVEAPIFFSHMSGEKVLMNLALLNEGMTKEERINKVQDVLKTVGLSNRGKDKVSTYSLGMKQRLGIAQALLNDPELIILDEPANGLDPLGMVELRELILRLNQERGITFLISSHLLDELQKICNTFIIIKEGSLVWQGSKETLLKEWNHESSLEEIFIELIK